jgi:hypothetical protein
MADYFRLFGQFDQLSFIVNYILLLGTFLYCYFRPKGNTEWLVVSSNTYVVMIVLMMFISAMAFGMGFFLPDILSDSSLLEMVFIALVMVPSVGIFLYILVSIMRSRIQMTTAGVWQISFLLYVFSLARELLDMFVSSVPSVSLMDLDPFQLKGFWMMGWYVIGAFLVAFGGDLLGRLIDKMFPKVSASHIPYMKELFGEGAPESLIFKDGSSASGGFTPGVCVGMGILYCLWMLLRAVLLP